MATVDRERLRALLAEKKTSARAVSRSVGDNDTLVKDVLSGKSKNPRSDTLAAIAEHLGVGLRDIMTDAPADTEAPTLGAPRIVELELPIRWEVAASGFLARDDLRQEPYGHRTVQAIPPYVDEPQWLERVVNDSMDKRIPPGSLLHVVDTIAIGYRPRSGDVVVVERTRFGGMMVERTVKEVELTPDGVLLWPRSHNPRWQEPICLTENTRKDEDIQVQIAALVLRSYQFFAEAA